MALSEKAEPKICGKLQQKPWRNKIAPLVPFASCWHLYTLRTLVGDNDSITYLCSS